MSIYSGLSLIGTPGIIKMYSYYPEFVLTVVSESLACICIGRIYRTELQFGLQYFRSIGFSA